MMGLLYDEVTFLNFDQTYTPQKRLRHLPHEWIDLNDIQQTKRYCTNQSLTAIHHRLKRRSNTGITFIGSGSYHYVSYLLLSEITEPFSLILFDYHTDMNASSPAHLISCGSWVKLAIARLPLLQKVVIIGSHPEPEPFVHPLLRAKTIVFPHHLIQQSRLESLVSQILAAISTDNVYISIDKDVLDHRHAVTDWDQGVMRLDQLLELLRHILVRKHVHGIDICGELPASPLERLRPDYMKASEKNERTNSRILAALLGFSKNARFRQGKKAVFGKS